MPVADNDPPVLHLELDLDDLPDPEVVYANLSRMVREGRHRADVAGAGARSDAGVDRAAIGAPETNRELVTQSQHPEPPYGAALVSCTLAYRGGCFARGAIWRV